MVKDKIGYTTKENILNCRQERFEAHLNTEFPHKRKEMLDIPLPHRTLRPKGEITTMRIKNAIASMINKEALGIDFITDEVLKASSDPILAMLYTIFNTAFDTEKISKDWAQMTVTPTKRTNDRELSRLYYWQSFRQSVTSLKLYRFQSRL